MGWELAKEGSWSQLSGLISLLNPPFTGTLLLCKPPAWFPGAGESASGVWWAGRTSGRWAGGPLPTTN